MTYSLLTPFLFSLLFNPVNAPAKEPADLILYHGVVHTLDERAPLAEAIAVRNGKILAVGSSGDIRDRFETLRTLDLSGKHVYPGFIDAHCHFVGFAEGLRYVDLTGSRSFDEVLDRLQKAWDPAEPGWLVGRGWDQNLWKEKVFPDNVKLNEQFPATPVMLIRIDGHVVLANQTALNLAAITGTRGFGEGQ
ncbi:MAG TPA: amidohydrolase family protein, partial [Bacteroidales bacterium]|nr:amidohydrolase family protein [Bacteroidales bacterium]